MTMDFAFRFALRDLRGGLRGFGLLLVCLALGVGAIGAVGLVASAVDRSVERDARALLGGDLVVEASGTEIQPAEFGRTLPPGATSRSTVRTSAILLAPSGRSLAVTLKGVEQPWPLVGAVELDPPMPTETALADGGIVVERTLLPRLGVQVGDRLRLGDREVTIRAVLVSEPERVQGIYGVGPRVVADLATLRSANILLPGAIATWSRAVVLPPTSDPVAVQATIQHDLPGARFRTRSIADVQPQIARFTDRLASYLTIAALASLLTAGIGIGLAVQGWLVQRRSTIATLKALGATPMLVLGVFTLQVVMVAALAALIGAVLATLLAYAASFLPTEILPIPIAGSFSAWPLLRAAILGIATALLFATLPLLDARDLPTAALFRPMAERSGGSLRGRAVALALGILVVAGLAALTTPRPEIGAVFALAALVTAGLLVLFGRLVLKLVHRLALRGPLTLRLALARLDRPGSTALPVVVATGTALAVLATVLFVHRSIEAELASALPERAPSVVFIDLQPTQVERFDQVLAEFPTVQVRQQAPVLRARVSAIKGVPVEQAAIAENARWTVQRDRGLSWSATIPPGSTDIVAGAWWPANYDGAPLVSIEDDIAAGYGVGVGDRLTFNVLGRDIEATVANIRREIDWSKARLDFVFILSPGLISKAPHTLITAVTVPPADEPRLLDAMAAAVPNVTPISISEVTRQVGAVIDRIAFAINGVALVTVGAGLLVLLGALAASRRQRRQQVAIYKVLGATRADLLRHFLIEHATIGLLAALVGVAIGTLGAWVLASQIMRLTFRFDGTTALLLLVGSMLVTGAVGAVSTWRILSRPAAPVLREA